METDVRTVVEKIGRLDHRAHGEYSAFAIFLNRELAEIQRENSDSDENLKEPLYGIVIPCGSFSTKAEAEERTAYLSAVSGAPVVVTCETGEPIPLSFRPCSNSVIYQRDPDKSICDLQKSISEQREKVNAVKQRIQQEKKERILDVNSVHTYIQNIYLCAQQCQMITQYQQSIDEIKNLYNASLKEIEEFERKNPSIAATWSEVAKSRLKERNELGVFNEMNSWFQAQRHNTKIIL